MPTDFKRMDDLPVSRKELATLAGWPELAGYVLIGIVREATPDGIPRVLMAADTADLGQVSWLLGTCASQIRRDARR